MATSRFEPSPLAPRRTPEEEARDRDLGFGSVVSRESRQRLLNRDGSFNVLRTGLGFLDSFAPYHLLMIWNKFPVWYHAYFLASLLAIPLIVTAVMRETAAT